MAGNSQKQGERGATPEAWLLVVRGWQLFKSSAVGFPQQV